MPIDDRIAQSIVRYAKAKDFNVYFDTDLKSNEVVITIFYQNGILNPLSTRLKLPLELQRDEFVEKVINFIDEAHDLIKSIIEPRN